MPLDGSAVRRLLPAAAVLAMLASPAAAAQVELDETYPLRGRETLVRVVGEEPSLAGGRLRVTYRPNSQTSRQEELPIGADGTVAWTPGDAGIVQLAVLAAGAAPDAAPLATHLVAVRFGAFPRSGLAVMLVAGLLLFGGAGVSLWLLLAGGRSSEALVGPPST